MASRYQQLRKENDQTLSYLGDSYNRVATIYVKKARGYASKTEDTEVKIRNVLDTLKTWDESRININVVIPNESEFIETHVKELSKKYKDPDMIKGAIWLTVIIACCIAWVVITNYFSKPVYYEAPKEFHVAREYKNDVTLKWREVENASEYVIYYEVDGSASASRTVLECEYTFDDLETGKTYTFYLYTKGSKVFNSSEKATVTYQIKGK